MGEERDSSLFSLIIHRANWLILVSDSLSFHAPGTAPVTLGSAPSKLAECCGASALNELLNVFAVLTGRKDPPPSLPEPP